MLLNIKQACTKINTATKEFATDFEALQVNEHKESGETAKVAAQVYSRAMKTLEVLECAEEDDNQSEEQDPNWTEV